MQYVIPATMVKTSTCMPPDFTKGRRRTFVRHHWSNVIALFKRRQYRANRTCRIRNPILNFFDDDVNLTMMNEEGTIERSARLPDENADVDIQKSTTSSGKRSSTTTKHTLFCFVPPWWHSTMVLGGPPWWFGGRQESRRAAKTVRRAAEISFTDRPVVRFLRSLRRILSCFPFFQTFTFFFLPFSLTVKTSQMHAALSDFRP